MSKNARNILILSFILILLILVYVVAVLMKPEAKQRQKVSQPIIGTLDISQVEIIDTDKGFILKKLNEIWILQKTDDDNSQETYPAKQENVENFLADLEKLKRGRLVSSNPQDLSSYNLGDNDNPKLLTLKTIDEEELFTMRIGVVLGANIANFTQINSRKEVYQIENTITNYLDSGRLDWTDLRLFIAGNKASDVQRYEIQRFNEENKALTSSIISMERSDTGWSQAGSSNEIDSVLAEKYLSDIFTLEGKDLSTTTFPDSAKIADILLYLKDGTDLKFSLFSFTDNYYAKTKGGQDTYTFTISAPDAEDKFLVEKEYFFAPEPEETEDTEEPEAAEDPQRSLPELEVKP